MKARIRHSGLSSQERSEGQQPLFRSGKGALVTDTVGRSYFDFNLGYGSVVVGHSDPRMLDRVKELLSNGVLLPGYTRWHEQLIEGWEKVLREDRDVAFFKTASEAVTASIRLASLKTQKKGVIRCGFLGWHDVLLAGSVRWHEHLSSPLRYESRFVNGFRGVSSAEPVFNWVSLELADLERLISENGHSVSCFVLDTYQLLFSSPEVIREAVSLCKAAGIIVIADETKVAGRVNPFGISHEMGLPVDAIVMGKAIGNGAPFSCLIGCPSLMALSEEARVTGTFSQELFAIYSAIACQEIMNEESYTLLRDVGMNVVSIFQSAVRSADLQDLVSVTPLFSGSMFELVFAQELLSNWEARSKLCMHLTSAGIVLLQGHCSYVSLAHKEIDTAVLFDRAVKGLMKWRETL